MKAMTILGYFKPCLSPLISVLVLEHTVLDLKTNVVLADNYNIHMYMVLLQIDIWTGSHMAPVTSLTEIVDLTNIVICVCWFYAALNNLKDQLNSKVYCTKGLWPINKYQNTHRYSIKTSTAATIQFIQKNNVYTFLF